PQARNFLEALLLAQAGSDAPLTDAEVLGNVFTMLMAGEDTTANTMAWMLHFMAQHPDVQARMQAEADAVLGTAAVLDDIAGAERLAYIEAAAHETMRLKPVAPLLFLEPKEDVQLDGLHVPRGTFLMLLTRPSGLRASGTVGDDAFRPERWLGGAGAADLHHAGFVPFGSGPRLCPGRSLALLEIKTAMSMVCRNFNVAAPARARPVGELFAFTMMPTNLRVIYSRRAEQGSGSSRRERALAANTE
ncbi:MAG TPA: cytochrome P450, partial [Burkholderiaceae bacterium]|nr:cytochrome P450 [Burkholderiaceae bacterium]